MQIFSKVYHFRLDLPGGFCYTVLSDLEVFNFFGGCENEIDESESG